MGKTLGSYRGSKQPDKIVKFEGISDKKYPEMVEDFHITHKNAPQKRIRFKQLLGSESIESSVVNIVKVRTFLLSLTICPPPLGPPCPETLLRLKE